MSHSKKTFPLLVQDRRAILFAGLIMLSSIVNARIVRVSDVAGIQSGCWQAGDTLLMAGSQWVDQKILLQGEGTAQQPIVLMTPTTGGVVLTGNSTLTIDGRYIECKGLLFTGSFTGKGAIVTFSKNSCYCRLTQTEIRSYNLSDATQDTKWVSLYGQDNRVDYCTFSNKTNSGTLLVVWLTTGQEARHRIDHCQFRDRTPNLDENGSELNGQEIIRIGDSGTSMTAAKCTVDSNYFAHCDGEIEIISNKSCGNTYRANTFYECKGTLTLRHGNDCIVEHNCFVGNDIAKTGGVRIIGENHIVRYNTLSGLAGTNYRAAVCIVRGKENSALYEYYPVRNAEVYANRTVNCKQAFCINYNSSSLCTVAPQDVRITDNTIYLDSGRQDNYLFYIPTTTRPDITLSGNVVNRLGRYENLTPTESEVRVDTQLVRPVCTPIATESNTGCRADTITALETNRTYTNRVCKHIQNGKILISIHNEKDNFTPSFGTTREYGVDGRCVRIRTHYGYGR